MARRFSNPGSLIARLWFPAALIVLLLMALPGIVLFTLHLFRKDAVINRWLQDNFQLTYHVSLPWWGALFLLLLPLAIVLLYFLKLKRKPLQVPSTFLWRKSIEDLHVNSLLQWLRENVLLLLQVLTVLALIYAAMAFQVHGRTSAGRHYILMIDNSASMAASDVAPSRLAAAKQEALQVIDSYTDDDFGMVIVFNSSAQILLSYTNDRGLLRRTVKDDIPQTQRPTRIEEALSLADGLANPQRSTENESARPANEEPGKERTYAPTEGIQTAVHLFSDGRFPDVPDFALGNLNMDYHPIGVPDVGNVGIVDFRASRPEGESGKLQVFVGLRNFRRQKVLTKVQLDVQVGGELRPYGNQVELPAREVKTGKQGEATGDVPGEASVAFDLGELDSRANAVLHARIDNYEATSAGQAGAQFHDPFPVDDEAWLVVGVVRKARVLIVGNARDDADPKKPLGAFFQQDAARRLATVAYLSPEKLKDNKEYRQPAREGAYDLVIFDRCSPAEDDLPMANTFFIDDVPPPWKKADLPPLENPAIRGWDSKEPLLRGLVDLLDIRLSEAFRFELDPRKDARVPPRTPRLLEAGQGAAVLFALARGPFTDLVMTFPIVNAEGKVATNWPEKLSFLIFLYHVLVTYGNIGDAAAEDALQPGQVKALRPDDAVRRIEVTDPEGHTEKLDRGSRAEFPYSKTDRLGVYEVSWNGAVQRRFAVNLLDAQESNIDPRPEIGIGARQVGAGDMTTRPHETWMWVALAALLLLLVEWYIYNRRVYI